jgi:hypothetical protein
MTLSFQISLHLRIVPIPLLEKNSLASNLNISLRSAIFFRIGENDENAASPLSGIDFLS